MCLLISSLQDLKRSLFHLNVVSNLFLFLLGTFEYVDFKQFPCNWVGEWQKDGHMYPNGLAREIVRCTYCKYSSYSAVKMGQLLSYRVKGITRPSPVWEWSTGSCENPMRCWGKNIRKWTVLKGSSAEDWVFKTTTSDPLEPSCSSLTDELREVFFKKNESIHFFQYLYRHLGPSTKKQV